MTPSYCANIHFPSLVPNYLFLLNRSSSFVILLLLITDVWCSIAIRLSSCFIILFFSYLISSYCINFEVILIEVETSLHAIFFSLTSFGLVSTFKSFIDFVLRLRLINDRFVSLS